MYVFSLSRYTMTTVEAHSIIKIVPVCWSMRKDSLWLIDILFIAPPLVSPSEHRVEISTLVDRPHPIQNPLAVQHFERRVAVAHDGLTDVVEAVIAVDAHFLLGHCGDGFGIIREAKEILANEHSLIAQWRGRGSLQDSEAGGTWRPRK